MTRKKDLFILVSDKHMRATIETLLQKRKKSVPIREITFEIWPHAQHDSGVLNQGLEFIRPFRSQYEKFLLMFDYQGSNSAESPDKIRKSLLEKSKTLGFDPADLEIIIINPELEIWLWKSPEDLGQLVGWTESKVKFWLKDGLEIKAGKPADPKDAIQKFLAGAGKQKSSKIFRRLAEKIGLSGCQDFSFQLLLETLRKWFPK